MRVVRLSGLLILCMLLAIASVQSPQPVAAQAQAQLSLQGSTTLQTGQSYPVAIRIAGVNDLWLANVEISYDPTLIYIVGTKAGSPVKAGDFFAPVESSINVRNQVRDDKVYFALSMLAPAEPVNGDGLIGTFTIYPIAPGNTQILFSKAELVKVNFSTDGTGQRIGSDPEMLPFTPILLQLTITGDKVEPPIEATATRVPTETPTPPALEGGIGVRTQQPTLVNVTAAPTAAPTLATVELPTRSDNSNALLLSLGLVALSVLGLLVVLGLWLRSKRRG